MINQLALQLQLNYHSSLADFCWGENHILKQQSLLFSELNSEQILYVWGATGVGKSHFLQGFSQSLGTKLGSVVYLPLHILREWGPDCLEDMHQQAVVAIDDIDVIAGNKLWEEALFHFYNKIKDNTCTKLIITAKANPNNLAIILPDLCSRLNQSLIIQLHELSDELKIITLQQRAKQRGFSLPNQVALFLITHYERNMNRLFQILERLDNASLAHQRKITIPFVKKILKEI